MGAMMEVAERMILVEMKGHPQDLLDYMSAIEEAIRNVTVSNCSVFISPCNWQGEDPDAGY